MNRRQVHIARRTGTRRGYQQAIRVTAMISQAGEKSAVSAKAQTAMKSLKSQKA